VTATAAAAETAAVQCSCVVLGMRQVFWSGVASADMLVHTAVCYVGPHPAAAYASLLVSVASVLYAAHTNHAPCENVKHCGCSYSAE
jgi:hypothetical protein